MADTPEDALVVETPADVRTVADEVVKGNCILFVGAGVHSPESEESALDLPMLGGELSKYIAGETGYANDYPKDQVTNLARVSLYAEHKQDFGRPWLIRTIRENVQTGKQPSPMLEALAGLPFRYIATTNYDNFFEQCLFQKKKNPQVVVYNPDRNVATDDYIGDEPGDDPTAERPFFLKMHGHIDKPESMVITDEDYIQFVLRMGDPEGFHPVPRSFHLAFSRLCTIFVGYSLLDYNLRLLFKTLRWGVQPARQPKTYSIDPYPDQIIQKVYPNIQFIVRNVWSFVPMLQAELARRQKKEDVA